MLTIATVPGQTYTVNYEILNHAVAYINAVAYACPGGLITPNTLTYAAGTYSYSFVASSSLSRLKWIGGGAGTYVISNINIQGQGDPTGGNGNELVCYSPDVVSYSDYFPFGMQTPNRNGSQELYRYGFNGKESDDEISGENNSYDFGARLYNPRVGRWLSRDPKERKYAELTPYNFVSNNPLIYVDPVGEEIVPSKAFQESPYSPILLKLDGNTLFEELTTHYEGANGADIPFNFYSFTNPEEGQIVGKPTANANTVKSDGIPTEINYNSDHFVSKHYTLGDGYTTYHGRSEIGMVRTMLHELIHADVAWHKPEDMGDMDDHEYMATKEMRSKMIDGLMEFAGDHGLEFTVEEYEVISWGGLQNTDVFKAEFDTTEKVMAWKSEYDRLDSSSSVVPDPVAEPVNTDGNE